MNVTKRTAYVVELSDDEARTLVAILQKSTRNNDKTLDAKEMRLAGELLCEVDPDKDDF